jgi:hypothetical protein
MSSLLAEPLPSDITRCGDRAAPPAYLREGTQTMPGCPDGNTPIGAGNQGPLFQALIPGRQATGAPRNQEALFQALNSPAPAGAETGRPARAADITLDDEFADLLPPLAPEERAQLESGLFVHGCREPLVVWRCQGRRILLTGYEQFRLLRVYDLPFRVLDKEFATRAEACLFIIKDQLARRNLSPLGVSYLRGLRYQAEKRPHGGDRRSPAARRPAAGGVRRRQDGRGFGGNLLRQPGHHSPRRGGDGRRGEDHRPVRRGRQAAAA